MTTRRQLLQLSALTGAAASVHPKLLAAVPAAKKPLSILILGGTGFTGPNQVNYALARGHKITLFNRGRKPKTWPAEVEELLGDRDKGDLAALKGRSWDVCIDNPTTVPFWVRDVGKMLKGKIKHYIFISTLSAYAGDKDVGADETAATHVYAGKDMYAETMDGVRADMNLYGPLKAASEKEAKKWFGTQTTIIRPGFIVGPDDPYDRLTYWLARMQKGGEMLVPGDGKDPVQYIDPRDLAEWTIRMAENRVFGTFNATGPNYQLDSDAFFYGLRAVTTQGAKFVWVDSNFVEKQELSPGGDLPVWIPRGPDSAGFATRSVAKAVAQGLTFRPLATTAADTLAFYNSLPAERTTALRAGLKPEREAELLQAWRQK
jgi:2'-hydroxyisoflavone reductase